MGSEQLRVRLQEWQTQQDLQKFYKTKSHLQQRNLELREQLDRIYEEEHIHEIQHSQHMERIMQASAVQSIHADTFHNQELTMIVNHDQQEVLPPSSYVTISPSTSPFMEVHATSPISPSIVPYSLPYSGPATIQMIPVSPPTPQHPIGLPMFVLPILPVPEQFQSYGQYLQAHEFWLKWHQKNAPCSLNTFGIY